MTAPSPCRTSALATALVAAALAASPPAAQASSHREAPFIASQPQVDATDFYMFRSYEPGREGYVTLIANYLPLQDPYGGPNYFKLDPNAVYEIHVTNGGSAVENVTFQFRVTNGLRDNQLNVGGKMVSIPLVQNGSGDVDQVERHGAEHGGELHADRGPRPAAYGHQPAGRNPGRRNRVRQAGRLHRHEDDQRLRRLREPAHPRDRDSRMHGQRPRLRRPAQGSVRREPGRDVRPRQHQVPGGRAQSAGGVRHHGHAGRQERDVASFSKCRSPA